MSFADPQQLSLAPSRDRVPKKTINQRTTFANMRPESVTGSSPFPTVGAPNPFGMRYALISDAVSSIPPVVISQLHAPVESISERGEAKLGLVHQPLPTLMYAATPS